MQLTRHDGPGVIVSKKAANLLVRLVERTLELSVYEGDRLTSDIPGVDPATLTHLEGDGVARIGTEVSAGMVLVGRVRADRTTDEELEGGRDRSLRCPPGLRGTIDSITMEEGAKNDPRLIKVVVLTQFTLRVGDVLEANGQRAFVSALTEDDDFELRWPGLEGTFEVKRLEPFAESVLHARSIGPYSVVTEQPLAGRDNFGGQRVTAQQLLALLERGATHTVRELLTVKSDDAVGRIKVYESIVVGAPACVPGVPRRTRSLERLLLSLGLDVDFTEERPRITLLSTAKLQQLAPGVVKKPETLNYRTLRPERDGLFCDEIFGPTGSPERAVNLGRIEFAVPMMHPLARGPVAKLLGIEDAKRFERLLYSEEAIDGSELTDDWASTGVPSLRAAAIARDRSAEKFFVEQWPVMPPSLRPLVPLDGGRFATSDLNDLYRRVINRNNRTKRLIELNAPAIIIRNEVRMMQESLEALVTNGAFGRSITGPDKRALVSLGDMVNFERGSLRSIDKTVDYLGTARFVVTREERVRLPSSMAYEIFRPWLYERLERAGHVTRVKEAKNEVNRLSAVAVEAMREHSPKATLLLFSSSGAIPVGVQGFEVWDEPSIGIGERLASRLALGVGDAVVLHAVIDPRAESEVLALESAQPKPRPREERGGWIARASRSNDPLAEVFGAALAEETDDVSDRWTRLLLARL